METWVIGGGLVGCAAVAMLQPDKWLTTEVGGFLLNSPFPPGPQYLHKTSDSAAFLSELKIEPAEAIIKWNWVKGNKLVYEASEEDLRTYALKSRGDENFNVIPSCGKNSFKSLRRLKPLAKELKSIAMSHVEKGKTELILAPIGLKHIDELNPDLVISTVPFFSSKPEGIYKEVHFQLWATKGELKLLKSRDYAYILDKSTPVYRVTKLGVPFLVITESLEKASLPNGWRELAHFSKPVQIVKKAVLEERPNLLYLGRFASNNSEYMFHDAIADLFEVRIKLCKLNRGSNEPVGYQQNK